MDLLEREDFEKLNRLADAEEEMNEEGAALLVHLKHVLSARAGLISLDGRDRGSLSEAHIVATGTVDISVVEGDIGGKHGQSYRLKKYLKAAANSEKWAEVVERSRCVACRQPPLNPYISDPCFHIYCLQYVHPASKHTKIH